MIKCFKQVSQFNNSKKSTEVLVKLLSNACAVVFHYVTDNIAISWIKLLFLESILSNFVFLLALRTHQLSFGPPHLRPQNRAARGGWTGRSERTIFDFCSILFSLFLFLKACDWKRSVVCKRGWRGTSSVPVTPCPVPQTIF